MKHSRQDRAIILRKIKHGESDLVLHVLDSQGLRLGLIAKGALRSKRRFGGGVLEPGHHVQITYHSSARQSEESLHVLLEATLIDDFPGLRVHYDRLQLALHFLKLVGQITRMGQDESRALFDLLGNALKAAENSEELEMLRTHFEMKLLLQQGILPREIPARDWLKLPLHKYAEFEISGDELMNLRNHIQSALNSYIDIR